VSAVDPRPALRALFEAVHAAPHEHDFFALLRRVESLQAGPRFGRALRPSQEALRLGQKPELEFAVAPLGGLDQRGPGAPRLDVRFFGLFGPQGPLPLHLTEHVRERSRHHNDPGTERFFDLFHHRLLSLFYRSWAQGQPTVQHDRPADDRYAAWLAASFGADGLSPPGDALPPTARLHQAGLLGSRSRHPEGLAKILSRHFGVPVRVQEHVAHRLSIDPAERSRLGLARNRPERAAAAAARLGHDATLGQRVWDRQCRFRIVLGPLTLAQYRAFQPGSDAFEALRAWVRQVVGLDLHWDLELRLARAQVPEPRLAHRLQLGRTAWLGRRARDRDAGDRGDLRLRPESRPEFPASTGA